MHVLIILITKLAGIIKTRRVSIYVSFIRLKSIFSQISYQYWVLFSFSHTAYKEQVSYSVNWQDPDYDSCEESSFSADESESDFGDFVCPWSPGAKYPYDERVFVGYQSKLREWLTSYTKCGFIKINQNLLKEGKISGSQFILHVECEKGNFLHPVSISSKLLQI